LRDREFTIDRGDEVTARTLANDDEVRAVLEEVFGMAVPAGMRLRADG
jgi:hypothetical protein